MLVVNAPVLRGWIVRLVLLEKVRIQSTHDKKEEEVKPQKKIWLVEERTAENNKYFERTM